LTDFVPKSSVGDEVVAHPQTLHLDDVDRKILRAFRFGGRLSNSEIARQVDVSEGTVRRRIAALEELGALKFVAITEPKNLGFNLNVLIGVRADGDKVLSIAERLAEMPEVPYTAIAMGSFDIWVTALLPSTEAWLEFRARLSEIQGVRSTETFHVTRVLKQNFDWVPADLFDEPALTQDPQMP
jgi:Lrp/AsnC family transcriptional regulator, regulator for asnA, asnC and gidA